MQRIAEVAEHAAAGHQHDKNIKVSLMFLNCRKFSTFALKGQHYQMNINAIHTCT